MPDNSSLASGIARIKAIAEDVYSTLGSGFSEDVYDRAMQVGLRLARATRISLSAAATKELLWNSKP